MEKCYSLSHVRLFVTPWTVACQASLSVGFSWQKYWSGLPFPSPEIFPTQALNPGLLHYSWILYSLSQQGSGGEMDILKILSLLICNYDMDIIPFI